MDQIGLVIDGAHAKAQSKDVHKCQCYAYSRSSVVAHGRARQRPLVVVRHPHIHLDIAPCGRLLQLSLSTLIRPVRDEIQCFGCDGQDEQRLVETPDRFVDPAVFRARNTRRPRHGAVNGKHTITMVSNTLGPVVRVGRFRETCLRCRREREE